MAAGDESRFWTGGARKSQVQEETNRMGNEILSLLSSLADSPFLHSTRLSNELIKTVTDRTGTKWIRRATAAAS